MREQSMTEMVPDSELWQQVVARDRAADGVFFYAVSTTGIYCRPSCPSRRPRRENVRFFESPEDAEAAGYRACHRCEPRSGAGTVTQRRIQRALAYIGEHLDERITLEQLGRAVGLSPFHLQRRFKEAVGVSPREYQDAQRLAAMKARLQDGMSVGSAVWDAGYGSSRGAYDSAAGGLGMTPGEYRRGAPGISIRYAAHDTPFGHLAVGWTDRGVCAVILGDSHDEVVAQLRREFPAADLGADQAADTWVRPILDYLAGVSPGLVVPVDARGTAFQLRVWKALQQIPPGETRSYAQVAEAIGEPGAARAVAGACAANRAALVIPCHRVVRSDGSVSGYRWGPERKRRLLAHEQATRATGASRPGTGRADRQR